MLSSIPVFLGSVLLRIAPFYVAAEVIFCLIFHVVLLPRANQLVAPIAYRDYKEDRFALLHRIFQRIEASSKRKQEGIAVALHRLLVEYFHVRPNPQPQQVSRYSNIPELVKAVSSSMETSDDEDDSSCATGHSSIHSGSNKSANTAAEACSVVPATTSDICLFQEDMDKLFAWTFFGKHPEGLLDKEWKELERMYQYLRTKSNIQFPTKPSEEKLSHFLEPRRMTLEPMTAIHRPLFVYLFVIFLKIVGGLFLRVMGYQRMVASTGVVGWYRPAATKSGTSQSLSPLLFFHGIAPGGHVLYLPMVLFGLATERDRASFIFENRSISCSMDLRPLTEEDTVDGILEILDQTDCRDQALSLVGHSFGSCTITWLVARARKAKAALEIQQVVLLDPVAILLSEPDVLLNFLYAQEYNQIRLVASSELFTEYFLRRNFAFYNSELWLEDLHPNSSLLVCVSENDQILNAAKVKGEVERYSSTISQKPISIHWEGAQHGACVTSPSKWADIKTAMLQQELQLAQRR